MNFGSRGEGAKSVAVARTNAVRLTSQHQSQPYLPNISAKPQIANKRMEHKSCIKEVFKVTFEYFL